MVFCCVGNCSKKSGKGQQSDVRHFLRFYPIPKDQVLRKKWEMRVNRRKEDITDTMFVCSDHFHDSDFESSSFIKSRISYCPKMHIPLKKDSIPNNDRCSGLMLIPKNQNVSTNPVRRRAYRFNDNKLTELIEENNQRVWGITADEPESDSLALTDASTACSSSSKLTEKEVQCNITIKTKTVDVQTTISIPCSTNSNAETVDYDSESDESEAENSSDEEYLPFTDNLGDDTIPVNSSHIIKKTKVTKKEKVTEKTYDIDWVFVNITHLLLLFNFYFEYGSKILHKSVRFCGATVLVDFLCSIGHRKTWQSSPSYKRQYLINIVLSAATTMSGTRFATMQYFLELTGKWHSIYL